MSNWRKRNSAFNQQEAEKSRLFNEQIGQPNGHLRDKDYAERAGMSNLSSLIAQEEQRSFGSGRVASVEIVECWSCGNALKDSEIDPERRVACKKCVIQYEAAEQDRLASYVEARTKRIEYAEAAHEEWRLAQYERRMQERAELESGKGARYETGAINQECESIQGSFGMDYLYNPILRNFFSLEDRALVPLAGDLILESGYKKEQVSGSGWVYWLLVENSIIVVEAWEENLFPAVIEKVEIL